MSDFALPDDTLRALIQRDRAGLAEQSAVGRGYVVNALNVQHSYTPLAVPLAVSSEVSIMANSQANEPFVPSEDVTETLPDGRVIQVAAKGVAIPHAEAVRRGLVKGPNTGPSELKQQEDAVNAQAAQAMRENTGDKNAQAPSVARAEAEQQAVQAASQQQAEADQSSRRK